MDANWLLFLLVSMSCAILLARASRVGFRTVRPQIIPAFLVLVCMGVTYALDRNAAGYVGGTLWLTLVMLPPLAMRWLARLVRRRQYARALAFARVARRLQPWIAWQPIHETLEAREWARRGRFDEALAAYDRIVQGGGAYAPFARGEIARLTGRWDDLADWGRGLPDDQLRAHPDVVPIWMRGLGETGDVSGVLAIFARYRVKLGQPVFRAHLRQAQLEALAFAGRVSAVMWFCEHFEAEMPADARQAWIAQAHIAAGDAEPGRRALAALCDAPETDPDIKRSMQHVLARKARGPFVPSDRERAILDGIEHELDQVVRYGESFAFQWRAALVTLSLLAANVLMFLVEVQQGGSERDRVLIRLGALTPDDVRAGQLWRIGASVFLHMGIWHLLMNMVALLALGPMLERLVGRLRFLAIYLVAGFGSMACVYAVARWQHTEQELVVGASGAIMAVAGAIVALMLDGWRREQAPLARRWLQFMVGVLALQVVFDQLMPHVSSTGHAAGAVLGFALTWVFIVGRSHPGIRRSPAVRAAPTTAP